MGADANELKERVKAHWEAEVCGSGTGNASEDRRRYFAEVDAFRYSQYSWIVPWARFEQYGDQRVLEVGLGSGSDFMRFAREGASATGRDPDRCVSGCRA